MTKFIVGSAVEWRSSNTNKTGIIIGVIPANQRPNEFGFKIDGGYGFSRDHESYIVKGGKVGGKQTTQYWPVVSLLQPIGTLTSEEIAWCHANVTLIRKLMAKLK